MRGFYPLTIAYSDAGVNRFTPYGNISQGIPPAPNPDIASGTIPLPRGVAMRSADPNDVKRGHTDSWNFFVERRLPGDLSLSVGYVGTATREGFADINLNVADSGTLGPPVLYAGRFGRHPRLGRADARTSTRCRPPSIGHSRAGSC